MLKYQGLFILFILSLSQSIYSQDIEGIPIIKNFPKSEYRASTQNWSICQGSEGYVYFGNNQGVLQYSGYDWQLVEMSNYSIVRSVLSGGKDSIFVGAFNELGLLNHDSIGRPRFNSWNSKIPLQYRNYGEIWRIHIINNFTVFQAFKSVLIFKNGEFYKAIVPKNEFRFSYVIDNELYIQDKTQGLLKMVNDSLELISGGEYFKDKEIWSLFSLNKVQLLIGTQYDGFYIYDHGKISVWDSQANQFMLKHTLFNGIRLKNNQLAFGSVLNGIIITNLDGEINSTINKQSGIQNNTILSLFQDNLNNIWLGLDNGIDYIKTNIPLSFIRKSGGFGTGYCSVVYNNSLYGGTNQGLFKLSLNHQRNAHSGQNEFTLIAKTEGQVWGLFQLNNSLLCGHNSGLFMIQNDIATRIFDICGAWDVQAIPGKPDLFIVGTYYGFYLLRGKNQAFSIIGKINGFEESARRFFFDNKGFLWMSHGYKGIYQLKLSENCSSIELIKIYNSSNDLPWDYNNEAVLIKNKILATTENGIYEFDYIAKRFIYNQKWDEFFNGNARQLTRMIEVSANKIWAFKKGSVQLLTYLNDKIHELDTRQFLLINGTLARSYENVLILPQNRFLLGTEDGFVLFNDSETPEELEKINLTIAWVECVYYDNLTDVAERLPISNPETNNLGIIPHRKRHIAVNLSMPFFTSQELVKFRYRMNNGDWGKWLKGNSLDINGLAEGTYKFEIQCSIDEKEIAGSTQLSFTISPPIQRTWYAYLFYIFMLIGIIAIIYFLLRRRIAHEKRKEYIAQSRKMIQQGIELKRKAKEAENELNKLRNEKLQADIIFKTKELANTTMGIIQKNQTLGEIREKLQEFINENTSLKENNKLSHLLRKINKGIEQHDEWKVFEKNFDQVHENFLHNLKEKHPELTAKDMRLAAYLRMNLASKEIAPLMNISVRSVEISRYRLRKKITIDHNQNLYDYLINL